MKNKRYCCDLHNITVKDLNRVSFLKQSKIAYIVLKSPSQSANHELIPFHLCHLILSPLLSSLQDLLPKHL